MYNSGSQFVVKTLSTCYQMMSVSVTSASLLFSGLPVNVPVCQVQFHVVLVICHILLIIGKLICLQCMLEHDKCEQGRQIFKLAMLLTLLYILQL